MMRFTKSSLLFKTRVIINYKVCVHFILQETGIGKVVKQLKKNRSSRVANKAKLVVNIWKALVSDNVKRDLLRNYFHELTQGMDDDKVSNL